VLEVLEWPDELLVTVWQELDDHDARVEEARRGR
jgi:hypothetical protein